MPVTRAVLVLRDPPARRVRRGVGDARHLEREAVREEHRTVEAVDEDGVIRGHVVDEGAVRRERSARTRIAGLRGGLSFAAGRPHLPLLVRAPVAPRDPAPGRQAFGRARDLLTEAVGLVHLEQVHSHDERTRALDVHVAVVEAGRHEGAAQVDDARVRAHQRLRLCVRPDDGDVFAADGDRLGRGPRLVERVHVSVDEDEIRGVLGSAGRAGTHRHRADQDQGNGRLPHDSSSQSSGSITATGCAPSEACSRRRPPSADPERWSGSAGRSLRGGRHAAGPNRATPGGARPPRDA